MTIKQVACDLVDEDDVYVRYRMDGSHIDLRRIQEHTMTQVRLIRDHLFADDAVSSPIQRKLCFASHLALRTPRGCMAMTSISERLRFFTCQSTEKNTDRPTSSMAMSNLNLCNSLPTWVSWVVVLTTLTYGTDPWVTYRSHIRLLAQSLHHPQHSL